MNNSIDALCHLIRHAMCDEEDCFDFMKLSAQNWSDVIDLAFEQGVDAISIDGLQKVIDSNPNFVFGIDSPELEDLKYE